MDCLHACKLSKLGADHLNLQQLLSTFPHACSIRSFDKQRGIIFKIGSIVSYRFLKYKLKKS